MDSRIEGSIGSDYQLEPEADSTISKRVSHPIGATEGALKLLEELRISVRNLGGRIIPILSPLESKDTEGEPEKQDYSGRSLLMRNLYELQSEIRSVRDEVEDLVERLDL